MRSIVFRGLSLNQGGKLSFFLNKKFALLESLVKFYHNEVPML